MTCKQLDVLYLFSNKQFMHIIISFSIIFGVDKLHCFTVSFNLDTTNFLC